MNAPTPATTVAICKQVLCNIEVVKSLAKNFEIFTDHVADVLKGEGNEDADIDLKRNKLVCWFDYLIALRDECRLLYHGKSMRKYQVNPVHYKCHKNCIPDPADVKQYFYQASEDGLIKLKDHLEKVCSFLSVAECIFDDIIYSSSSADVKMILVIHCEL